MVYGNDVCMSADLRELSGGRLNGTLPVHGRGKHLVKKLKLSSLQFPFFCKKSI